MYNTFNMGIGMMVVVDKADANNTMAAIMNSGEKAFVIGEIKEGEKGVTLI
jgi:phosphoribosylformylglycinamidine cyclo-ligase